jgi:cytidyltransferase-like protein
VREIRADYEVVNDTTKRETDIQVEGIAQKQFGEKLVAVGGAFDPIRKGHIRYFKKARELGRVVVIMRNNPSIILKKNYVFMPDVSERKELLESFGCVNAVVVAVDKDQTSNRTLELLKPDIYAKGGDRKGRSEAATCEKIGCEIVAGIVPVYTSSSQLVEDVVRRLSDGH